LRAGWFVHRGSTIHAQSKFSGGSAGSKLLKKCRKLLLKSKNSSFIPILGEGGQTDSGGAKSSAAGAQDPSKPLVHVWPAQISVLSKFSAFNN